MRPSINRRVAKFVLVGISNTAISFVALNLAFYAAHIDKVPASIVATIIAMIWSFILNRWFVFGDRTKHAHRQVPAFLLVTISGSILVANLVYVLSLKMLTGHEELLLSLVRQISGVVLAKSFADINISASFGALVAMGWNYNGYKWFVFKGSADDIQETQPAA